MATLEYGGEEQGMENRGKLMDFLVGYAGAHQHPFNIFVHLLGIPIIMLGVLIPLTWVGFEINAFHFYLAHALALGFFAFYLTLDIVFALVFAFATYWLIELAILLGNTPGNTGWYIAAACFFGGYLLQFLGHAVEKSIPVLVKHPVQANIAAPFFTIVEIFKLLGLRAAIFDAVQQRLAETEDTR